MFQKFENSHSIEVHYKPIVKFEDFMLNMKKENKCVVCVSNNKEKNRKLATFIAIWIFILYICLLMGFFSWFSLQTKSMKKFLWQNQKRLPIAAKESGNKKKKEKKNKWKENQRTKVIVLNLNSHHKWKSCTLRKLQVSIN